MQVSTWYACFRVPVCRVSTRTGVLPFRFPPLRGPSIVNPTIRFTTEADLSYTLGSGRRLSHPPSSHPQGLSLSMPGRCSNQPLTWTFQRLESLERCL